MIAYENGMGYMPREVLPEVFSSFRGKLDELCVAVEDKLSADTEERIINQVVIVM